MSLPRREDDPWTAHAGTWPPILKHRGSRASNRSGGWPRGNRFYLLTFAVGVSVVVALGADLISGITASIACLGNIGPGFNAVGPMAHFADLHPVSKIVLTLEMWIGRLEVTTVLVLLRLEPWRTARWSAAQRSSEAPPRTVEHVPVRLRLASGSVGFAPPPAGEMS